MTSRYRVDYALKSHRRDELIEWIKSLLSPTFVLHTGLDTYDGGFVSATDVQNSYEEYHVSKEYLISLDCQKRYHEIFTDIERLIDDSIVTDNAASAVCDTEPPKCRLRQLVPSVGRFFTPLPLSSAFLIEDKKRSISSRRFVSPSFNDIRMVLNTAQILALGKIYKESISQGTGLKLITFDGDVTLYEDGASIESDSPVIKRISKLLSMDIYIGVVTAAGYPGKSGAIMYYKRFKGLIDYLRSTTDLTHQQKNNFMVMGGESNYLFRFDPITGELKFIESELWHIEKIKSWEKEKIYTIVDKAEKHLRHLQKKFNLEDIKKTQIIRKERSVGIIPSQGFSILREQLEEIVLSCSMRLSEVVSKLNKDSEVSNDTYGIKYCVFNGGSDVWADIGDKSLGVESLQQYICGDDNFTHSFCPILKSETLHVGDQFASLGANDFKARLSACTAWITSPTETIEILDFLISCMTENNFA